MGLVGQGEASRWIYIPVCLTSSVIPRIVRFLDHYTGCFVNLFTHIARCHMYSRSNAQLPVVMRKVVLFKLVLHTSSEVCVRATQIF